MKVYVVMFNQYYQYEYDQSTLREVFDSMKKAEEYIQKHSSEVIENAYQDHNFEIIEKELA